MGKNEPNRTIKGTYVPLNKVIIGAKAPIITPYMDRREHYKFRGYVPFTLYMV